MFIVSHTSEGKSYEGKSYDTKVFHIYIALVPITTKGYPFKRIFKKDRVW